MALERRRHEEASISYRNEVPGLQWRKLPMVTECRTLKGALPMSGGASKCRRTLVADKIRDLGKRENRDREIGK